VDTKEYERKRYLRDKEKIKIRQRKYKDRKNDEIKEYQKQYRLEHKNKSKAYNKNYFLLNKERELNRNKLYLLENKETIYKTNKNYRIKNKTILSEKKKEYYCKNKDIIKEYKIKHKEKIKEYNKKYYNTKKDILNQKRRIYVKNRMSTDNLFRLKNIISSMINGIMKKHNYYKKSTSETIIGCTFIFLLYHIENQFEDWMNWSNYGKYNGEYNYGWDIDHIIELKTAKTEEDVLILNHYSNLRPLDSKINRVDRRNKDWKK